MMRRLDLYVGGRFLKMIGMAVASFVVIFISVDAFEHFSRWVDRDVGLGTFLRYYYYGLPYVIVLVMPVAVLLSSLFLVASLSKRNELVAMRCAGISIPRIFLPLIAVGLFASLFVMVVGDFVVSDAMYRQAMVKRVEIENKDPVNYSSRSNFAYRSVDGSILEIGHYNGRDKEMTSVSIEWFDDSSRVERRLEARKVWWADSVWMARSVEQREFGPGGAVIYGSADTMAIEVLSERPADFATRQKSPDEMNFFELQSYIDKVRSAGGDTRGDRVELYLKILFPLSNLIMVLVGAPLATRNPRSGKSTSIGIAIFLAFLFFSLVRFGQTLGHKGALDPLLAACLADAVYLALGAFLLFRAGRNV
jgi:lipopolysaccharide export system permease protein